MHAVYPGASTTDDAVAWHLLYLLQEASSWNTRRISTTWKCPINFQISILIPHASRIHRIHINLSTASIRRKNEAFKMVYSNSRVKRSYTSCLNWLRVYVTCVTQDKSPPETTVRDRWHPSKHGRATGWKGHQNTFHCVSSHTLPSCQAKNLFFEIRLRGLVILRVTNYVCMRQSTGVYSLRLLELLAPGQVHVYTPPLDPNTWGNFTLSELQ